MKSVRGKSFYLPQDFANASSFWLQTDNAQIGSQTDFWVTALWDRLGSQSELLFFPALDFARRYPKFQDTSSLNLKMISIEKPVNPKVHFAGQFSIHKNVQIFVEKMSGGKHMQTICLRI